MTKKEEFLKIETYEEFDRRRAEFQGMKMDQETLGHAAKIFPKVSSTKEELFKTPPGSSKERIIGQ